MSGKSDAHPVRDQTASRPGEPPFLFNALNTIKAVIRRDSEQASQLVQYLSTFSAKLKAAFGVCYSRRRN